MIVSGQFLQWTIWSDPEMHNPSVTVHTRGKRGDEDKLQNTVFNVDIRARQVRADTQEHRGVTSRPDKQELNWQELNTQDN